MDVGWSPEQPVGGVLRVVILSVADPNMPLAVALAWKRNNASLLLTNFIEVFAGCSGAE
jgi:hypothetical protein